MGAVARVRSDEAFDVDDLADDDLADDACEAVDFVDAREVDDSDADGIGRAMVTT